MKNIKIKDIILHNFALKILAVIFAVIIWVIIVNIDNPKRNTTISGIPVKFLNEEVLVQNGYTYVVQSGSTVSITIKAPQSIAENLEASDFYAYADLSEITIDYNKAPIKVSCEKKDVAGQVDIVSLKTENVVLNIDHKVTKTIPVESYHIGECADGYIVGDSYVSPATVTVTGAESIVNKIVNAKVGYNISDMTHSISEDVKLSFYDEYNAEVKAEGLLLSRNTVRLNIEILPTKKIPVNYNITGEAKEGYFVKSHTTNIGFVTVAAKKEVIDQLSSIQLPDGLVDITGLTDNKSYDISLQPYLPAGVRIVSSERNLKVELDISKRAKFDIPYEKVALVGCSNSYDYEIEDAHKYMTVTITGDAKDIDKLDAKDIYLSASMGGKTVGKHIVRVDVETKDNLDIEGSYEITVIIKEKEEITESPTTGIEDVTTAGRELATTGKGE